MPAVPEQLLAAPVIPTARIILVALWAKATADPVPFCAGTPRDLAKVTGHPRRTVERVLGILKAAGLIARTARELAGRRVAGWELSRVSLRPAPPRRPVTTRTGDAASVAVREEPPKPTAAADLAALLRVAVRGDSEVAIARKLAALKNFPKGYWHKIKVHRRVEAMKRDLGITESLRAGEVVHRWKMVKETG